MLKRIHCGEFRSEFLKDGTIEFHEGLNAVVGDSERTNAIGKSTFLMVLDFVFGGNDYTVKCKDVQFFVPNQKICFTFCFDNQDYHFFRKTEKPEYVYKCNDSYTEEDARQIKLDEYRTFLQTNYRLDYEKLSWREAVSPYIRVNKRDTMDRHRPLDNYRNEKGEESVKNLLCLFHRYSLIEDAVNAEKGASAKLSAFTKSQQFNFVRSAASKTEFKSNETEIKELQRQMDELVADNHGDAVLLDDPKTSILAAMNEQLNLLRRERTIVQNQLNKLRRDHKEGAYKVDKNLEALKAFFPDQPLKELKEVEEFHRSLSAVMDDDFREKEKRLGETYDSLRKNIFDLKQKIEDLGIPYQYSDEFLDQYTTLNNEIRLRKEANKNFLETAELRKKSKQAKKDAIETARQQCGTTEQEINGEIYSIRKQFPNISTTSPVYLHILDQNRYSFTCDVNGSSGYEAQGLILYDLAILHLTPLPFLIHDAELSDPIDKPNISEIIKAYDREKENHKQIFTTIRAVDLYETEAQKIINANTVLKLAPGRGTLFGKSWTDEKGLQDKK